MTDFGRSVQLDWEIEKAAIVRAANIAKTFAATTIKDAGAMEVGPCR
jgi:outer membrane protease